MVAPLRTVRWVVLAVACATASCSRQEPAMARVGDRYVELASFQQYVADASGEAWQVANARVASRLLDQFLDRAVVLEAARARDVLAEVGGASVSPSELRWLMEELCGAAPAAEPERIAAEVALRLQETQPAKARVRQILVDDLDRAVEARQRLQAGEDFGDISRELSRAPNAAAGGELGFIEQESLPPEIDAVVFALAPGEISQPVQGNSGYHVIQVLDVVPAGAPERSRVEAEVRSELGQQAARDHTRSCVDRLAAEVGVRVNRNLLWFPYEGRYTEEASDDE